MIWIEAQNGSLYYCSALEINRITTSQILIVNQSGKTLGEYFDMGTAIEVLEKVKEILKYSEIKLFTMPHKIQNNEEE